jgi:hypothetical protein
MEALANEMEERSRILGLQLEFQRLHVKLALAVDDHGTETPEMLVRAACASGFIGRQLEAAERHLQRLKAAKESLSASQSSQRAMVHAFGKQRPRGWVQVAAEHLQEFVEQLEAGISIFSDVLKSPEADSEYLGYLRERHVSASRFPAADPTPCAHAAGAGSTEGPASLRALLVAWQSPVAHVVGQVPPELACVLEMRPSAYSSPGMLVDWDSMPRAAQPQPAIQRLVESGMRLQETWHAAPTLLDPDCSLGRHVEYRIAKHESLKQALLLCGDGDVVLLAPGRYNLSGEPGVMRRNIRVIGMGLKQQVCMREREGVSACERREDGCVGDGWERLSPPSFSLR